MKKPCFVIAACFTFLLNSSCYAGVLFTENFEGTLDSRLSVSFAGTYSSLPGAKDFTGLGGSRAFGFGLSTNGASSFFNYMSTLTINFDDPTFVSTVSFVEREAFGNWGSQGEFYTSAESPAMALADPRVLAGTWGDDFGRLPHNDFTADTTFRTRTIDVNAVVTTLSFQVWDITNRSEIYIDDLVVSGAASTVPEPTSCAVFGLAALCLVAGGRNRQKHQRIT